MHSEYHYAKQFITVCHGVHLYLKLKKKKPLNFKLGLIFYANNIILWLSAGIGLTGSKMMDRADVGGMHLETVIWEIPISRPVGKNIFKYPSLYLTVIRGISPLQRRYVVQRICEP